MIISKLYGGLGNQLFQYAFGRYLAIKNNTELKLDTSVLEDKSIKGEFTIRTFQLDLFSIHATIASDSDIEKFNKSKIQKIKNLLLLYLPIQFNNLYIKEPYFHFFDKALKAPKNVYIDGYWQSEKYFLPIREQLLKELKPKNKSSEKTAELEVDIKATQSVSIHVRRGDYISIKSNNEYYETCTPEYYASAITYICEKLDKPVLYLFSDEPSWFEQNVKTKYKTVYITHNIGNHSYEDMYLMSLCKHNIIANSSFSWWGAWLNANANKIVVAPKNWFKIKSKNSKDLLPKEWIQL